MPITDEFCFVFIPANESEPILKRTASKSGGLQDDALIQYAKCYFQSQSGNAQRLKALDEFGPEERVGLAAKLRAQAGNSPQANAMSDDTLIQLLRTSYESTSCEITAITVPTKDNNHRAVSMYGGDDARTQRMPFNKRATELMVATGHAPPAGGGEDDLPAGVCGDVFVGRCHDDEVADIWERVDFTVEDADCRSEWCREARKPGGGGGRGAAGGGGAAPSLSGLMAKQLAAAQGGGAVGAGGMPMLPQSPGGEVDNGEYKWSQTDEEIELKFKVAPGTKSKYVKVNFGRKKVKVTVAGQTLVNGETGGDIIVDESTYTLQDDPDGGRELCITLGKADASNWPYPVNVE
mmetsp:Transcript_29548/g.65095  ORF Transcript_29548/g.65095 Transcript_29548/m.65095 type:complete len:350 (-) Transcript_29548:73-1122(-)|eukprot:CAMPEP_0178641522 /NCGR_PEP_ID=MMETSP0698-20121128/16635_1 /TAXON_ID=265572 /ORGANISM="Extubocellulus spinifer, Strain CCMP396" /LENGTH=349 /DNA_ID=CAMNT_0020282115 /DNA_START=136 /DNA_END=1185 /DNA_ORIENTATION=+